MTNNACLIVGIWILGLLGIIFTSIAINNAKKLKDQGKPSERSMGFLIVMLIVFIVINIAASIYGFGLYNSKNNMKKYYKQLRKMFN